MSIIIHNRIHVIVVYMLRSDEKRGGMNKSMSHHAVHIHKFLPMQLNFNFH